MTVTVERPNPHGSYEIHVNGERWATVETVSRRFQEGRRAYNGCDWDATSKRAETIANGLRAALARTDGKE